MQNQRVISWPILGLLLVLLTAVLSEACQPPTPDCSNPSLLSPEDRCNCDAAFLSEAERCDCLKAPYDTTEYIVTFDDSFPCLRPYLTDPDVQLDRGMIDLRLLVSKIDTNQIVDSICLDIARYLIAVNSFKGGPVLLKQSCGCRQLDFQFPSPSIDPSEHLAKSRSRLAYTGGHIGRNYQLTLGPLDTLNQGYDTTRLDSYPGVPPTAILVGIVDMGIQTDHPDLEPYMWEQPVALSGCFDNAKKGFNPYTQDDTDIGDDWGHGTHIAGIIALDADPSVPSTFETYQGLNKSGLRLMNIKISEGSSQESDLYAASCGIIYAMENGVDILNLSWGYYADEVDSAFAALIKEAGEYDILIVAAAGNDSINTDSCRHWPSGFAALPGFEHVVSIAAIDTFEAKLASFSNFGTSSVSVAAPGDSIRSTFPVSDYGDLSGTSMAAPFVSRLAVITKLKNPGFSMMDVRNEIMDPNSWMNIQSPTTATNQKVPMTGRLETIP